MARTDPGLLTPVCYDKLPVIPRCRDDPTPYDGEENPYGNPSTLLDHTPWWLLSPRGSTGRHRTHAYRPRHTVRGILAPLLAAHLLCRRTARSPAARPDLGGRPRGVPRLPGHRGAPGATLSAPGDFVGVWPHLGTG